MIELLLAASLWTAPVELPADAGPWAAAPIPGDLELRTGGDFDRVRLLDARGDEVPYRIVDPARNETERWRALEVRNLRRTDGGWRLEMLVPAGVSIDALRIAFADGEGVHEAAVRGPDGGVVVDALRLGRLGATVVDTIDLPSVDLPRLHIELTALVGDLEPVGASGHVRSSPFESTPPAALAVTVSDPVDGPDGRSWTLGLPTPAIRIDRLEVDVATPTVFRRTVAVHALELGDGEQQWVRVGGAVLERVPLTDGRPGLERRTVAIRPGAWRRLRLEQPDGSERPLELASVRARPRPRWLLVPTDGSGVRLVAGDTRRSRTLEERTTPVDLARVARGRVGDPSDVAAAPDEVPVLGGWWVTPLFLGAAVLLAWLAWRLLVRAGTSDAS
jgi:hypothetical protein